MTLFIYIVSYKYDNLICFYFFPLKVLGKPNLIFLVFVDVVLVEIVVVFTVVTDVVLLVGGNKRVFISSSFKSFCLTLFAFGTVTAMSDLLIPLFFSAKSWLFSSFWSPIELELDPSSGKALF